MILSRPITSPLGITLEIVTPRVCEADADDGVPVPENQSVYHEKPDRPCDREKTECIGKTLLNDGQSRFVKSTTDHDSRLDESGNQRGCLTHFGGLDLYLSWYYGEIRQDATSPETPARGRRRGPSPADGVSIGVGLRPGDNVAID